MPRRLILVASVVLAAALVSAQEINVAIGLGGRPAKATIVDDIADARERRSFLDVWEADPRAQAALAERFIAEYPRSLVLREAYELAARAHASEGHLPQALTWAKRALRLM